MEEDIANDLKQVIESAKTQYVKQLLESELTKVENRRNAAKKATEKAVNKTSIKTTAVVKNIDRYGWDQSDKFVKLYISLSGINSVPKDQINVTFTSSSVTLLVSDFNKKNYALNIKGLNDTIVPNSSTYKVKTDDIIISMKKEKIGQNWPKLTKSENKETPKPSVDPNEDPSKGIMDMMKKMYDEGDDEMKRTIAKAWTESREKNMQGGMM